ncbi:RNA methyltransferase [Bacillota bacterium LX-D]|nr:RNA methyltransferase [Bacillota bacterium LX-D]
MATEITSRHNHYIKLVKNLEKRKFREETGLFVLEGFRSLQEAMETKYKLEAILLTPSAYVKLQSDDYYQNLEERTRLFIVEEKIFNDLAQTQTPQGILIIAQKRVYKLDHMLDSGKLVVVADGIQDPGNLGTIIRTMAAAGAGGLLLTGGSVDVYNPKVLRSTMGGIFYLPFVVEDTEGIIKAIENYDYNLVVADINGRQKYYEIDLSGKVALVIGNENHGPADIFLQRASSIIKIPMPGGVESLNASVAAAILIYETVRQKGL